MQLIGILRWAVEIGRIDIYLEVSLLSQYQANPRLGHLEAIYHTFSYLKCHLDMGRLAYDSRRPDIDERIFHPQADWKEFDGDVEEEQDAQESVCQELWSQKVFERPCSIVAGFSQKMHSSL